MISIRLTPVLTNPDRGFVQFSKDGAKTILLQDRILGPGPRLLLDMPPDIDGMALIDPVEELFERLLCEGLLFHVELSRQEFNNLELDYLEVSFAALSIGFDIWKVIAIIAFDRIAVVPIPEPDALTICG